MRRSQLFVSKMLEGTSGHAAWSHVAQLVSVNVGLRLHLRVARFAGILLSL